MSVNIFTVVVLLGGLFCSSVGAIYLQLVFSLFGGAEAVGLPALGGANVTPAVLFMPFMMARAAFERPSALNISRIPKAGFTVLLFAFWGVVSAILFPRAFMGQTMVMAINRGSTEVGVSLSWLKPVSGNVTQPMYAVGSAFAFLGVSALLVRKGRLEVFRDAALTLAALNVLAGLINVGESYGALPSVLEYTRTAQYAQFGLASGGEFARIQGTFSEASGFAGFSLPLFAFTTVLWIRNVRPVVSGLLAMATLVLLALSTSSTAYVSLAGYFTVLGGTLLWRARSTGRVPRAGVLTLGVMVVVLLLGTMFAFEFDAAAKLSAFFDATIGSKMESDSGVERASWNKQAWTNFIETYGMGIGLGTARTSSLAMALLSNVGLVGTILFVAFIAQVLRPTARNVPPSLAAISMAAQHAVIATLFCALVSGTTIDLGLTFYAFAAAAAADPLRHLVWPTSTVQQVSDQPFYARPVDQQRS
jgi:hypothetical protein